MCDLIFFIVIMLFIPLALVLTPPASEFERNRLREFKEEKRKNTELNKQLNTKNQHLDQIRDLKKKLSALRKKTK